MQARGGRKICEELNACILFPLLLISSVGTNSTRLLSGWFPRFVVFCYVCEDGWLFIIIRRRLLDAVHNFIIYYYSQ